MAKGATPEEAAASKAASAASGMPAVGGDHPDGSWACSGCSNVNWPKRTSCNRCNMPKPGMYGSMPGMPGMGMPGMMPGMGNGMGMAPGSDQWSGRGGDNPPGSWPCPNPSCGNVK